MNDDSGIGSVRFEKRPLKWLVLPAIVGALILFVLGIQLLVLVAYEKHDLEPAKGIAGGIGCFLGSAGLIGVIVLQRFIIFRIHPRGISESSPWSHREMRFDQIDLISFLQSDLYFYGGHLGTQAFLLFGCGTKSIYFNSSLRKTESTAELLIARDLISERIAARLSEEWEKTGKADWTNLLRFADDGLEYFAQEKWQRISFVDVGECVIDQGYFYLRARGSNAPLMIQDTIAPNFYPGVVLLNELASCEVDSRHVRNRRQEVHLPLPF